jgi:hypothetical protein
MTLTPKNNHMFLDKFFAEDETGIYFNRCQGSSFAKQIAGDFNPIHDEESKRFCVPGDLLFSLVLNKYGLSQKMRFSFSGMVANDVRLIFPETRGKVTICDANGKEYLSFEHSGETSKDPQLITEITRRYVAFSGQTFPHILVPLMADNGVMINPERPLVIYESMSIDINRLDISDLNLELSNARLNVDGKRGTATLEFILTDAGELVGTGAKSMVLSGLRPFEQAKIDELVAHYSARKDSYRG